MSSRLPLSFKLRFLQKDGPDDLPRSLPWFYVFYGSMNVRENSRHLPNLLMFSVGTLNVHCNTTKTHSKLETKRQCKKQMQHIEEKTTL